MRKFHRNWLVGGLIIGLIFSGTSVEGKEASTKEFVQKASLIQEGAFEVAGLGSEEDLVGGEEEGLKPIQEVLLEEMEKMQPSIYISEYHLNKQEFALVLQEVLNSSPQLFYADNSYGLSIDPELEIVRVFRPYYNYSKTEVASMRTEFERATKKILAGIQSSWSDTEKVLYIHDVLAKQNVYDLSHTYYDAYHLLVDHTAVCQGYALAFMYFMNQLGIPCETVTSKEMGHMWNMVQVDGQWYHVDVTYDDPTPDVYGAALHSFLLVSDAEISRLGHHDWECNHEAKSTLYDGYFWTEIEAPFVYEGGKWFYVDSSDSRGGVYQWNPTTNHATCVLSMRGPRWRWYADANSYYTVKFSGLVNKDGYVFVNSAQDVYYFQASNPSKLYQLPIGTVPGNIYGLGLEGNQLKISIGNDYNDIIGTATVYTFEDEEEATSEESAETLPPTEEPESGKVTMTPEPTEQPAEVTPVPSKEPAVESSIPTETPAVVLPQPTATPEATLPPMGGVLLPEEPEESEIPMGPVETIIPSSGKPLVILYPSATPAPSGTQQSGSVTEGDQDGKQGGENQDKVGADSEDPLDGISSVISIKITAKKGAKKIGIKTLKKAKVQVVCSKKILKKGKRKYKKITIAAKKNKKGKITIKLSSRLKKKMKIKVTVTSGKKRTVTKIVK